jgi:hypothetical protein
MLSAYERPLAAKTGPSSNVAFNPTETSSGIGSAINVQALSIDIPATLLGRATACSLNGLGAQL